MTHTRAIVVSGTALLLSLPIPDALLGASDAPSESTPPLVAAATGLGGFRITEPELDLLLGNRLAMLRTEEYQIKRQILDGQVAELLLARAAAAREVSLPELMKAEVDDKVPPVTSEDVRNAIESGGGRKVQAQSDEEAAKTIASALRAQRVSQRRAEFVRQLRAEAKVKIFLSPPRLDVPTTNDRRTRGPAGASVTIVWYSDFQCPYCARLATTLKQIEELHGQHVRFVFRDFPLPFHEGANRAAEAALCAEEQGNFWPMYDKLLANQKALAAPDIRRYAADLGLSQIAFDQCLDSGRHRAAVRESIARAETYGVTSTPTLFVNGRVVPGAVPFEALDSIVREELERTESVAETIKTSRFPGQ